MYFLKYFCQKSSRGATLLGLLLQTTRGQEKSGRAVIHSPAWRQSEYQSVSSLGLLRERIRSRAWSIALSKWTIGAALIWASS